MDSKLKQFWEKYQGVDGWLLEETVAIWDCLLSWQKSHSISGNFLEIGVWKGKSAILECLHAKSDELCVFVDLLMFDEVTEMLKQLHFYSHFYRCKSQELLRSRFKIDELSSTFRWIHIDGAHWGAACYQDLYLANRLLSEEGIICVDDFFNPSYPQVTASVFDFLNHNPFCLKMFLCGFNKAYLARPYFCDTYLSYLLKDLHNDLKERDYSNKITLFKTSKPSDYNCFGMKEYEGKLFIGLDENPTEVLI